MSESITETIEETHIVTTNDGDHEKFAHYVESKYIADAMILGKEVTALCGKKWIPSRDPEKFPICPTCKEIISEYK